MEGGGRLTVFYPPSSHSVMIPSSKNHGDGPCGLPWKASCGRVRGMLKVLFVVILGAEVFLSHQDGYKSGDESRRLASGAEAAGPCDPGGSTYTVFCDADGDGAVCAAGIRTGGADRRVALDNPG